MLEVTQLSLSSRARAGIVVFFALQAVVQTGYLVSYMWSFEPGFFGGAQPHGWHRVLVGSSALSLVSEKDAETGRSFYGWDIPHGFSYHPNDTLHAETLEPYTALPREHILATRNHEEVLYDKKVTLGDVDVGYLHAFATLLAISKKGKLLAVIDNDPACWPDADSTRFTCGEARPNGILLRNNEIHAFAYYSGTHVTRANSILGEHPGGWAIVTIRADGSYSELVPKRVGPQETSDPIGGDQAWYRVGSPFADKEWTTFGWRGKRMISGQRSEKSIEATYRWNAAEKKYALGWQGLAPSRPTVKTERGDGLRTGE